MGMTDHHRVELSWVKAEPSGVALVFLTAALNQATVNQYLLVADFQTVQRTGDLAGGTVKPQLQFLLTHRQTPLVGHSGRRHEQAAARRFHLSTQP